MEVKEVTKQIRDSIIEKGSSRKSSRKDEIDVMKAMLNDDSYIIDVYEKSNSETGYDVKQYAPGQEFKKMVTNIVSDVTGISRKEARELVNHHEFGTADARTIVNLSKEFVNTYLRTGRRLPLGGRIDSDVSMVWKNIESKTLQVPSKIGGERKNVEVPAHGAIKTTNPYPRWII